jgi:hypothetical protein
MEGTPMKKASSPLRVRFSYDKIKQLSRPLLGENFVLERVKISSLQMGKLLRQEVALRRNPLAIIKRYYYDVFKGSRRTSLILLFALCIDGFADAIELLFSFAEDFERPLPMDEVIETAENYKLGDFGLAWAWLKKEPEIVSFVRNNVFVVIQAQAGENSLLNIAQEIDGHLNRLSTTDRYVEEKDGIFSQIKRRTDGVVKVKVGEKVTIGSFPKIKKGVGFTFFLTTSGSMNREIAKPEEWYYRAGMEKGKYKITLLHADIGILPKKEQLDVVIT